MRSKTAERIRRDLEQRGVAPEFSEPISNRLERFTDELTADTYEAVLSGVAMAYGVHRRDRADRRDRQNPKNRVERQEASDALGPRHSADRSGAEPRRADPADLEEVQRLMSAFAGELSKLDEALETLSAYVTRLRTQTSPPERTLH